MQRDEYHDHLAFKNFKTPFVAKLREFHGQSEQAKLFTNDIEDERDKSKWHWDKDRRYYNQEDFIEDVIDIRDRARVLQKKRHKTRTFAKNELLAGLMGRAPTGDYQFSMPNQNKRHISTGRSPSQLFIHMQLAQEKLLKKLQGKK